MPVKTAVDLELLQTKYVVIQLALNRSRRMSVVLTVAAAGLLIAICGRASPQKFEKRVLTIFRQQPDPYESAHQLDCSLLFPTAIANGTERLHNFLLSDPTHISGD